MKRVIGAVLLVTTMFSLVTTAGATAKKNPHATYAIGHAKKCRVGFVKKTERHKVKGKTRRYVACVWRPPVKAVTTAAPVTTAVPVTTPAPSPAPTVTVLAVTLDPSFTQNPANARDVTWSFSASATNTQQGVNTPAPSLPSGILDFFLNGNLACSENVGGSVSGGTCEVANTPIGSNTTVVEYQSGSDSATATEMSMVEPFAPTLFLSNQTCQSNGDGTCDVEQPVLLGGLLSGVAPNGTFTMTGAGGINEQCSIVPPGYSSSMNNETAECTTTVTECVKAGTFNSTISFGNDSNYPSVTEDSPPVSIPANPSASC